MDISNLVNTMKIWVRRVLKTRLHVKVWLKSEYKLTQGKDKFCNWVGSLIN